MKCSICQKEIKEMFEGLEMHEKCFLEVKKSTNDIFLKYTGMSIDMKEVYRIVDNRKKKKNK